MPSGPSNANRVAIVGASSLRGKELKQVLEDRNFPAGEIILLDESVMAGTLTEAAGEPTFIRALEEDSFEGVRFAFFAGTAFDAERNWLAAQRAGATVIDLTGAVMASGRATMWIPSLAAMLAPRPGSRANGSAQADALLFASHAGDHRVHAGGGARTISAAAHRDCFCFLRFPNATSRASRNSRARRRICFRSGPSSRRFSTRRSRSICCRPTAKTASRAWRTSQGNRARRGRLSRGARAGAGDSIGAGAGILRICFRRLRGISRRPCRRSNWRRRLSNLGVKIAAPGDPAPTNVSVAGESEIQLARIEADRTCRCGGVWFWGVADNLRLAATNAVRIAEELVAESRIA